MMKAFRLLYEMLNPTFNPFSHLYENIKVKKVLKEVDHRLSRFGFDMMDACLRAVGRKIIVINESECRDDLVQDFIDVVTSMCARIYGKRSAKNKAKRALEAVRE